MSATTNYYFLQSRQPHSSESASFSLHTRPYPIIIHSCFIHIHEAGPVIQSTPDPTPVISHPSPSSSTSTKLGQSHRPHQNLPHLSSIPTHLHPHPRRWASHLDHIRTYPDYHPSYPRFIHIHEAGLVIQTTTDPTPISSIRAQPPKPFIHIDEFHQRGSCAEPASNPPRFSPARRSSGSSPHASALPRRHVNVLRKKASNFAVKIRNFTTECGRGWSGDQAHELAPVPRRNFGSNRLVDCEFSKHCAVCGVAKVLAVTVGIGGHDSATAHTRVVAMGNIGSSSSNDARRLSSRYDNTSSSSRHPQPQPSSRAYPPYENPAPSPPSYPPQSQQYAPKKSLQRRFSRKYSLINDNFSSVEQVQQALGESGLESSNLIVGIDFTKSNEWTGKHSFGGRSLHALGTEPNPYEKALAIVGKTLSKFDEDNLIPCFGFGDSTTHDKHVFSFNENDEPCEGFEEALARYRTIVPHLRLAGPTSFAPIINAAVDIVEESEGQYHVLIIIADGQVTRSVDVADGQQSPQEQATVDAIVNASNYPLSIVLVGVGDGPWDMMREFDDNLPRRSFDNFQFVNFTAIMQRNLPMLQKEASFALAALMEIPQQYKATLELDMLSKPVGSSPGVKPLPPPPKVLQNDRGYPQQPRHGAAPGGYNGGYQNYGGRMGAPAPAPASAPAPAPARAPSRDQYSAHPTAQSGYGGGLEYSGYGNYSSPPSAPVAHNTNPFGAPNDDANSCPVCLSDKKDMAFNCGHQTCRGCANSLQCCPICREVITTRIRLF